MTNPTRVLAALAAASLIGPAVARAEPREEPAPGAQPEVTASVAMGPELHFLVETSIATTYVFRGAPQYLDKTDPSSQTTIGLTIDNLGPGSLGLGVWNATALTSYGEQPTTKLEIDIAAAYALPVTERLSASVGYIGYLYPENDPVDAAHELTAALSFASGLVTPTLAVFAEVVRLKGVYAMLGLTRDFELAAFTLSAGASVAISGYEGQDLGLHDVGARLAGKWSGPSGLYVGASVSHSYDGVREDGTFGDRSTLWAMAFVGFSR
jgi:uncharacterized protein (TIGR02001 family)